MTQRRRTTTKQAQKPIPLKSEVDEPRPQPPASEAPAVRDGRNAPARREAANAGALEEDNVQSSSLFDEEDDAERDDADRDDDDVESEDADDDELAGTDEDER